MKGRIKRELKIYLETNKDIYLHTQWNISHKKQGGGRWRERENPTICNVNETGGLNEISQIETNTV